MKEAMLVVMGKKFKSQNLVWAYRTVTEELQITLFFIKSRISH